MRNAITWFDIPSTDFDRALKFYSQILDEELKVQEFMSQKLGFFPMDQDGQVGGDLVPPGSGNMPSKVGTRVYLNCNGKLDEVLGRVEAAGGKIIEEKSSIGEMGDIATIEDTEGNVVGLHSYK
jgi:predicted enzyme related to lactoylglutathione lyase